MATQPIPTFDATTFFGRIKVVMGMRESTNNYGAVNDIGYIGKYQFGAGALIDLGYCNRSLTQQILKKLSKLRADEKLAIQPQDPAALEAALERQKAVVALMKQYFVGKDGIVGVTSFLENYAVQEKCMDQYMLIMEKRLKGNKVILDDTTIPERAGYICAAHLIGQSGCRQMKDGVIKKDGNGVTGNEYYKIGYNALAGKDPTITPQAAKPDNQFREPTPAIEGTAVPAPNSVGIPIGSTSTTSAPKLATDGFSDPSGVYPTYTKEQDFNRLARGQKPEKTIVHEKEGETLRNVKSSGDNWSQPMSPYNAVYPYNHVFETESGHIVEFDDTPDAERIHIYHRTGTFLEIDANGTEVHRIIGDGYTILDRNGFISIAGKCNITVEGDASIVAKSNLTLEVNGNLSGTVSGDCSWKVEGNWSVDAYGFISEVTHGGYSMRTYGPWEIDSMDRIGMKTYGPMSVQTHGNADFGIFGATNINSYGKFTMKGGAGLDIASAGAMELYSQGSIVANGTTVDLNPGNPQAQVAEKLDVGKMSDWQPPHLPSALGSPELPILVNKPRAFEEIAEFDDAPVGVTGNISSSTLTENTATMIDDRQKQLTDTGLAAVVPLTTTVNSSETVTPTATSTPIAVETTPNDKLKSGAINMKEYITKNFRLADFVKKDAKIVGQQGLTDVQLATNLKLLAENCIEPIKQQYPEMTVYSGLRPMGANALSQHPLGMAADLHFNPRKYTEFITIAKWIVEHLTFDQCILEYRSNSPNSVKGNIVTWIHVSYRQGNNRKMFFTMDNDKVISKFGEFKVISAKN